MTLTEFKETLNQPEPPEVSRLLIALWFDGKDNWDQAHNIAQDDHSSDGSWVHAYLHRKEGDLGNAGYWYARANRPFPNKSLKAEWDEIVEAMISK